MKNSFFLLFVVLILACQGVTFPSKPENLIPEEKMVDILTESYLSNAARNVNNRLIKDNGIKLDSFIYTKFAIDSLQFTSSNAYYASKLDAYERIFVKVEERLAFMKKEKDSIINAKKELKNDSISKKDSILAPIEGQLISPVDSESN